MVTRPGFSQQDKGGRSGPAISLVIPVHDEEANLDPLYERLERVLEELGRSYEVIFVDDGSRDGSLGRLRRLQEKHDAVRVIQLNRNYGQHAARSEERRVGKEGHVVCRSRWSPYH